MVEKSFIGDLKQSAKTVGAVTLGIAAVGLAADVAAASMGVRSAPRPMAPIPPTISDMGGRLGPHPLA